MKLQYAIEALQLLKQTDEKLTAIQKQGLDLAEFVDPLICKIEVGIATMLCDGSESVLEQIREHIAWWAYDCTPKIIYYEDHELNVETVEDFTNWLLDHCKP